MPEGEWRDDVLEVMVAESEADSDREHQMEELANSRRSAYLSSVVPQFKGAVNEPHGD